MAKKKHNSTLLWVFVAILLVIAIVMLRDSLGEPARAEHECTAAEKVNQICTLDYRPVCGNNGRTYSNGCSACASAGVTSYTAGACAE